jgi:hypothetical protein
MNQYTLNPLYVAILVTWLWIFTNWLKNIQFRSRNLIRVWTSYDPFIGRTSNNIQKNTQPSHEEITIRSSQYQGIPPSPNKNNYLEFPVSRYSTIPNSN